MGVNDDVKHGEIGKGEWRGARRCATHGWHGPLYICPTYSVELKAKLVEDSEKFRADLSDPNWIKRQLDNGVPAHVIAIFKAMSD